MKDYDVFPSGDQAVTISFGNTISETHHRKLLALRYWMKKNAFDGLQDVVIGYSSLMILYNAAQVVGLDASRRPYDFVCLFIGRAFDHAIDVITKEPSLKKIPVCYEAECAPDLPEVSHLLGLSPDEIVSIHTEKIYYVYMIGFLPGFPYMASVDERLRVKRKLSPRARVPAGSVGLAGLQTGIYPFVSPGGWQIIGQTPIKIFDTHSSQPSLLESGDRVQFYKLSLDSFRAYDSARL
jgi:inhibitor of KinA